MKQWKLLSTLALLGIGISGCGNLGTNEQIDESSAVAAQAARGCARISGWPADSLGGTLDFPLITGLSSLPGRVLWNFYSTKVDSLGNFCFDLLNPAAALLQSGQRWLSENVYRSGACAGRLAVSRQDFNLAYLAGGSSVVPAGLSDNGAALQRGLVFVSAQFSGTPGLIGWVYSDRGVVVRGTVTCPGSTPERFDLALSWQRGWNPVVGQLLPDRYRFFSITRLPTNTLWPWSPAP